MATKFLIDDEGSFLLVEPGSILLVEGDPAVFAYKTVPVGSRISTVSVYVRDTIRVATRVSTAMVAARVRSVSVAARGRRIGVQAL